MREITSRRSIVLVLTCALVTGAAVADGEPERLVLVDDQGRKMEGDVEICCRRGVEEACERYADATRLPAFQPFDSLWVEGPAHGPASARLHELERHPESRELVVRVPRKTRMAIDGLDDEAPVALSLYRADDADLRRPVHRVRLDHEDYLVPSGDYLASLSSRGAAPVLARLTAEPGGSARLTWRRADGWSLVLRVVHGVDGRPVPGATTSLRPSVSGFGPEQDPVVEHQSRSGARGLTIFNALSAPLLAAEVEHEDFLPSTLPAVSSSPGTFAFHEVELPVGASLQTRVLLDHQAASGHLCRLLRHAEPRNLDEQATLETAGEDRTGTDGTCWIEKVQPGPYLLRVEVEGGDDDGGGRVVRALQLADGTTQDIVVELGRLRIEGTVSRGPDAAAGYQVLVFDSGEAGAPRLDAEAVAEARTDDDGRYAIDLWSPGRYHFAVRTPTGTPATFAEHVLDGDEAVDFQLARHGVAGRVVDDAGEPVAGAGVALTWRVSEKPAVMRSTTTDGEGYFEFPMEDEKGIVTLVAAASGYRKAEIPRVAVDPDLEVPPQTLRLERVARLVGVLRTALGAPVAGGWVALHRALTPEHLEMGLTGIDHGAVDAQGRFDLAADPTRPTWLFFGGAGCPLGVRSLPPAGPRGPAPVTLTCASGPANLEMVLSHADGGSRHGASVVLRRGDVVFPASVLRRHLLGFGLPPTGDGRGRLFLVALEPGDYELYLAEMTSPFNVAAGQTTGHLASVSLPPLATSTVEAVLVDRLGIQGSGSRP